jgi:SAM-dependent methyltransferase
MSKTTPSATLKNTSYAWKQITEHWQQYFFEPSRPSPEEVNTYRKWLKTIRTKRPVQNALVLGATPELRDVLNELGFRTHSIDINIEMMLALNGLVTHQNPEEVLIRADWLNNPLRSDYFDVILGDAVFPNIPWDRRQDLYHEIVRILKPGGHYINRAFYAPDTKRFQTIEAVLVAFADKPSSNRTAIELVFEIQLLTHDPVDHLGSMEKLRAVVEKLRGPNGFNFESQKLNKTLDIIWSYWLADISEKVWVYSFQHEEESEYQRYFDTVAKFSAHDHPYGQLTPLYLLQKNDKRAICASY